MKKSIQTKKKKTATRTTKSKVVVPVKPTKLPKSVVPTVPTEPLSLAADAKFPGEELVPDKLKMLFRLWHKGMKDGSLRDAAAENGAYYLRVLIEENQRLRNENVKLHTLTNDLHRSNEQLENFRRNAINKQNELLNGIRQVAKDRDAYLGTLEALHEDIANAFNSSRRHTDRLIEQAYDEEALDELIDRTLNDEACDDCDCDGQ